MTVFKTDGPKANPFDQTKHQNKLSLPLDEMGKEFDWNPTPPFHLISQEDINWVNHHREELRKKYEGLWLAISQEKVVASGINTQEAKYLAQKHLKPDSPLLICFMESSNVISCL